MTQALIIGDDRPDGTGTIEVTNPAHDEVFETVARAGPDDVDAAVDAADRALSTWSHLHPRERADALRRYADVLEEHADELAHLESRNVGKPIGMARWEAGHLVETVRYFAGAADKIMGEQVPLDVETLAVARRRPVGVVGLIVPWNFPMVITGWKLAPALAAGNTVVVKPASLTPLTALRLGEIALEAGLPPGTVNVIPGPGRVVGEALVTHPGVAKVSFTGETATGRQILALAAEDITRVTLELGGKSPNVIFDDVDAEVVAASAVRAGFANTGQDCCSRSRVLVHEAIHDDFVEALVVATEALEVGDPASEDTEIGPLVSAGQRDHVEQYVDVGREEGAVIATGGDRLDRPGFYLQPAVLDSTEPSMRVVREEIFGPVICVTTFETEDEAVRLANDTIYGLSGSVWSGDVNRAIRVAGRIDSGVVSVNASWTTHLGAPFGGMKQSGLGRELGLQAFDDYTEWQSIFVNLGGE